MKNTFLLMAASIVLLAACSGLEQPEQDLFMNNGEDLVEKVIFEVLPVKDGDAPETRASAVPNGGTVGFVWEATDTVGIYPDKGSQVYFNIEDGVGTSSVSFTGGGWALKQNSTYTSYYPFVGDIYLKRDKIPVSFAGQKQIGTSSPFVGARYYLATGASTSENGVLRFSYSTLNTIINVNATLPAGTYTKMSLTVEEPLFIEEGTYSLDDRTIVGTKFTNTLEIELEDVVLTEETAIPIYIMSAPVDLKGKEVIVRFMTIDDTIYKCTKPVSKTYLAGTRYGLTCNQMEKESQPNNIIYYTSSNGNKVTPYALDTFGANIISNQYEDGHGVIVFDGDVVSIGAYAFNSCSNLISITIPDSVTSIGDNAFQSCRSLTSITIPDGVTSIGGSAFSGCTSLTSITIPHSVTSIGAYAFYNCTSLTSITIPDGVTSIGGSVFSGCTSLTSITIPDGVTSIGDNAFSHSSLTSITIPDGVTSIGAYAFYSCSSLTNITIPESVSSIGDWAFNSCISLLSFCGKYASVDGLFLIDSECLIAVALGAINGNVTLPEWVTSIEHHAFFNCSGLTSISIPISVTSIRQGAFYGCANLTSIVIPDSVTSIGAGAFYACTGLTSIKITQEAPPTGGLNMFGSANNCPIYVPVESVEAYKTAEYWSDYADRIEAIPSIPFPEAVDLGLPSGIKWAAFNLGASKPEEYGDYYAWGETEPYYEPGYAQSIPSIWKPGKEAGYLWASYKWCMGTDDTMTKYCYDSSYGYNGFTDGKSDLDSEDDAAYVKLGDNWRIPTDVDWTELRQRCTWTWTTLNGIPGRLVTASNGNSIFLPAAGERFNTSIYDVGSLGHYWSSSRDISNPSDATYLFLNSSDVYGDGSSRCNGFSIRPVCTE